MPRPKANRRTKKGEPRYTARLYVGAGRYEWVGTFKTPQERDEALKKAREGGPGVPTCDEYADRFLAAYERRNKASSYDTARAALRAFRDEFGHRPLDSITPTEAEDWANRVPASKLPIVVTLFNRAADQWIVGRNPFKGLGARGEGRKHEPPPTDAELMKLLDACSALGWYANRMRSLVRFACYSGMRPGEIFQLKWSCIDFDQRRITVTERLYKGKVDTPKSNKPKTIALTPPALDAITSLPRDSEFVFTSKQGKRLTQETLSRYWGLVLARSGLDFDWYLASKHFAVNYMWTKLGLTPRAIAEQMGWSHAGTMDLLGVYGHGDIGALEEIDAAFERRNVTPLRAVEGE